MTRSYKISFFILASSALLAGLIASVAFAQSKPDIQFPVTELGGCKNEKDCRTFCDNPDNFAGCFAFAKKHKLLEGPISETSDNDIEKFSKILGEEGGPGGCKTQTTCESYCNNINNIEACVEWGEKHGVLKDKDLEEAKKVRAILKEGGKTPGNCTNKAACEAYCKNPNHIEECVAFGEKAGFIKGDEARHARKFAEQLKRGETPGGCDSKESCEAYCDDENNMETCIVFAEKQGFATKEEVEMMRRTGGKGPGGCKGRQCESFCNNPDNQETCFNWAKEQGMIKPEELERMEEGKKKFKENLSNMPPNVRQCLQETLGRDALEKIERGEEMPRENMGDKMRSCFEKSFKNAYEGENFQQGGRPQEGQGMLSEETMKCIAAQGGEETLRKLQQGGLSPQDESFSQIKSCFDFRNQKEIRGNEGMQGRPPMEICKENPEQCGRYPQESQQFEKRPLQEGAQEDFCKAYPERCNNPNQLLENQNQVRDDFCKAYPEKCGVENRKEGDRQPMPINQESRNDQPINTNVPFPPDQQFKEEYRKAYEEQYREQYQNQINNTQPYPSQNPTVTSPTPYPSAEPTPTPAPTQEAPTPAPQSLNNAPNLQEFLLGLIVDLFIR